MTSRTGRLMTATAAGIVFALAVPSTALADGIVTVDCGDGSPLTAAVDAVTLTSLQASIQGMIDNPSGMTCALSQSSLVDPTLTVSSSDGNPFVVGGGRYDRGPGPGSMQGCGLNVSISAHVDSSGFHGQQMITINNADGCSADQGQVKANVTCLKVDGNVAQIKGIISEATGPFFSSLAQPGDTFENDVVDNGSPSGGTPDMIGQYPFSGASTSTSCEPDATLATFPIENGNITVHG
jgi:hypothetical protein